ncbi:MAG TPA: deoxyguanosinetriphosphate triphosphohydrolase [Abditibacteriaceae bacterium]|jgi:dGTPase
MNDFSDIYARLLEREELLDARATRSAQSQGRAREEEPDAYRTEFQRDRDRIIHTKAFRRLKHKTQVFVSPERDHYRTRLTHTLEVTQISRTVACALNLNEDLVEAIGMGHDLGHAPFGHVGEEALDEAYRRFDSTARFRHYEQSLRIVDELEPNGRGLNLTWEVRDGILHHSKGRSDLHAGQNIDNWLAKGKPSTLEGQIIRICDRVAYVNHDVDDAIRAGLIRAEDIPRECVEVLGERHAARITTMVNAILEASSETQNGKRTTRDRIAMRDDAMQATDELKNWMFDHVYKLDGVDETPRVRNVIGALFEAFMNDVRLMNPRLSSGVLTHNDSTVEFDRTSQNERARVVCDYIAGMTDRFASQTYADLFLPSSWRGV